MSKQASMFTNEWVNDVKSVFMNVTSTKQAMPCTDDKKTYGIDKKKNN